MRVPLYLRRTAADAAGRDLGQADTPPHSGKGGIAAPVLHNLSRKLAEDPLIANLEDVAEMDDAAARTTMSATWR